MTVKRLPILAVALGSMTILACTGALAQGRGNRDYGPMVLGDWLFTPTVTAGGIYNDNVFSTRTNKKSSFGTNLGATGYANRDDGVSRSSIYFSANADIYLDASQGNSFTGALGGNYAREFGQDVLFNGNVEIARLQNTLRNQGLTGLPSSSLSNSNYTQFQGGLSLRRNFNRFYLEGGINGTTQVYDKSTASTADKNGWSGVARARLGYDVAPALSIYAEPSINTQRYNSSFYETNVYKGVVGVTFPRLGLFSGNVYAGYMWANYPNAVFRKWDQSPTLGGNVSWLPTQDITITLAASQSFGLNGPGQNSAFSVVNSIPGAFAGSDPLSASPTSSSAVANQLANQLVAATAVSQQLFASAGARTKTSTASLGGRYEINALTFANLTFSYQNTSSSGITTSPTSDVLMARLSLDYAVWANWGVTGTYTFARVLYDRPGLSYSQNIVTVGVSGRL